MLVALLPLRILSTEDPSVIHVAVPLSIVALSTSPSRHQSPPLPPSSIAPFPLVALPTNQDKGKKIISEKPRGIKRGLPSSADGGFIKDDVKARRKEGELAC
ncbi:hypothetical protein Adt_21271 [Abeliophyllum distichum]|uniref:Uncharacterized protein n=1 Tax=Abeliophyllum distichum TaxID=126358 RepID=A0ABD1SYV1_9LAMI